MTAYVDESLRTKGSGLYLVAAAIVLPSGAPAARKRLDAVLLPGQLRFHWRLEAEAQRARMLNLIAELKPAVLAYACQPLPRRQDRARALCVHQLLWDLREMQEGHIVFETREPHNDRKDAETIEQARRSRASTPRLTYDFEAPEREPLLWMSDALAGAISMWVAEGDSTYVDELPAGMVRLRHVAP